MAASEGAGAGEVTRGGRGGREASRAVRVLEVDPRPLTASSEGEAPAVTKVP